jgi:hypothetical protein
LVDPQVEVNLERMDFRREAAPATLSPSPAHS